MENFYDRRKELETLSQIEKQSEKTLLVYSDFEKMLDDIVAHSHTDSTILVMSNGGFNGIHQKLLDKLHNK